MQSIIISKSVKYGYSFKLTYSYKRYNVIFYAPNGGFFCKSFKQFCKAYSFYKFLINNQYFKNTKQNSQLTLF